MIGPFVGTVPCAWRPPPANVRTTDRIIRRCSPCQLTLQAPFKGVDSDAKTRHRYLLLATYAVPLMKDGEFVWTEHKDAPIPDCEES